MAEDAREALYRVVASIPRGRLASYGQVAELAGLPGRARWVGRILSQLPTGSKLPWHRVVLGSGRIAFAEGSERYQRQFTRLRKEGAIDGDRLRWRECRWQP